MLSVYEPTLICRSAELFVVTSSGHEFWSFEVGLTLTLCGTSPARYDAGACRFHSALASSPGPAPSIRHDRYCVGLSLPRRSHPVMVKPGGRANTTSTFGGVPGPVLRTVTRIVPVRSALVFGPSWAEAETTLMSTML